MSIPKSRCIHIYTVGDYTKEDIIEKQDSQCDTCRKEGPYLWVCLHKDCLYVGCNECDSNHCVQHFEKNKEHSLFLNLTSLRVFCLLCDCEVFLENNDPPMPGMLPTHPHIVSKPDTDSDDDADNEENIKPRGLTGLQNLGNTCYMNSAIQALSNCPQLTNFFLECEPFVRSEKKPGLSKSYTRLMKEMWHKKRSSYVVPSGIAYGIKIVCPVFRGYTQQDAQEFLRCFMDQLHEELKEPVVEIIPNLKNNVDSHDTFDPARADSGIAASEDSSHSDGEYETCDSGLSSEKTSFVDEGVDSQDTTIEHIDLIGDASTLLSFNSSKADFDNNPSIQSFTISNHEDNVSHKNSFEMSKTDSNENCLDINYYDSTETAKDSKNVEGFVTGNSERFHHLEQENVQLDVLSNTRASCITQIKQANPDTIMSILNARKQNMRYRSIVSDIFDGKILSSVQCLTCDTVSTIKETFQDLSLPIPNKDYLRMIRSSQGSHQINIENCKDAYNHPGWFSTLFGWVKSWFWGPSVNLQDCLAAFFSADELKGDNMYSCEKCKKLRNGIKFSKVIELPEVLCIHLKRFRHEVMFSSKINTYVSFDLEGLDMAPFLHKSYHSGATTYDLVSVICHHGTAESGHYTAYSLNYLNDQWYEFDDQYVTAVDPEMITHCEAYVLFYRKCGDEMIKKRKCAVELMELSQNEPGLLRFHISKQWINKFNNFAEPGPISNTDFLCSHGGVPPHKVEYADELCTILPQAVWEYLHDTFGGGPPCTHLYMCPICQAELNCLNQKRIIEMEKFTNMNAEFQRIKNPSVVYAISSSWFKTWKNFVCKDSDVPGPIDNNSICYTKNNQAVLRLGSDYYSISKEMFQYLQGIYGGGPEIILQRTTGINCPQFSSHMNHINHVKSLLAASNSMKVTTKVNQSSQNQESSTIQTNCDQELICNPEHTKSNRVMSIEENFSLKLNCTNI
ncbi:hypothetical protein JTE90_010830 [Oedothorax gibbosus]|uniref:Ubiquitin carboxyl-terminal hydrolase n=1 Tax=Oedothorax gibbosus TaxID=931172 RepID=A0AAV6V4Y5_9ARAC|nr:hypothetical protein JTE90_010830 [Oedothorax gibbosus]